MTSLTRPIIEGKTTDGDAARFGAAASPSLWSLPDMLAAAVYLVETIRERYER